MKSINFDFDDVANSMGGSVAFKELDGKEVEIIGMCISSVDGIAITTLKGADGEYYAGQSTSIRKTFDAIADAFTDAISDGKCKEEDFHYNVKFTEGTNGKRSYMTARCTRIKK